MRVISGKCRGTKLEAPEGVTTRPTVDRIKETLFNMIAFDIPGCDFLDLFSGSGAIGIESLSRGANKAVFVEKDKNALKCINKNLEKTRLYTSTVVYNVEVAIALEQLKQKKEKFDIIFLDPPYALPNIEGLLEQIVANDLLKEGGYIILERGSESKIEYPTTLRVKREKQYKTTTLSFLERS